MIDVDETAPRQPLRAVWAHPAARALLLSRMVSDVGDFLGLAAILLYAFEQTGTLLGPGAAFAAQAAPAVLIGLFAGRRLNATHPRHGLVATHLVAALTVGVIATTPPLTVVLAAVVVLGALRTTASSLRMAAIASSVPEDLRQRVLALSSTSYQVGQAVGFLGGAALVAATDPSVALLADAATFVVGGLLLSTRAIVAAPAAPHTLPRPAIATVRESLTYVFSNRALAILIPLAWLTMLTSALPEAAAPALTEPRFAGLLMAAAPAASAIAATRYATGPSTTLANLTAQAARYGFTLLLLALAIAWRAPLGVLLLAVLAVGAANVWVVGVQTRLANLEDPSRVAEVYAVLTASMIALEGIGAGLLGLLSPITGPAFPVALLATALTLVAARASRREQDGVVTRPAHRLDEQHAMTATSAA